MNYNRVIEIIFELSGVEQYRFRCDGSSRSYRSSFTAQKSLASSAENNAEISVYNLSGGTVKALIQDYYKYVVTCRVGYENSSLKTLFSGYLKRVWFTREGLDKKVTFTVCNLENPFAMRTMTYELSGRTITCRTMPLNNSGEQTGGGAVNMQVDSPDVKNAVYGMACLYRDTMYPELEINLNNIRIKDGLQFEQAERSWSNQTFSQIMNGLGREFKFTWSIQDNYFFCMEDNLPSNQFLQLPQGIYKLNRDNLLSSEVVLAGDMGTVQQGFKCSAILDPVLFPGMCIDVDSFVYPEFNNIYRVHEVSFSGSSYSAEWKMDIQALFNK